MSYSDYSLDDKDHLYSNPHIQFSDTGEIDLHGYSTGIALDHFVSYYNDNLKTPVIKVVHGYGSSGNRGEIRSRLRTFLREHENCLRFEVGENIDNNKGYTLVYPNCPLPPMSISIEDKILDFCATPKSEEKILGNFRIYSNVEVRKSIKSLQRHRKIRSFDKGKHKIYEVIIS